MPTITLNLDVTNAELTRLAPAVRDFLGLPANATNNTILAEYRNHIRRQIVGIVKAYEDRAAAAAAQNAVTEIAPT